MEVRNDTQLGRLHLMNDGKSLDVNCGKAQDKRTHKLNHMALDGIRGWEASKSFSIRDAFCKAMGWAVDVKIGDTTYLVGKNSAINFIKRNNIAVPGGSEKGLSNSAIKTVLEGLAAKRAPQYSVPGFSGKPVEPPLSARANWVDTSHTKDECMKFLKDMKIEVSDKLFAKYFKPDGAKFSITADDLVRLGKESKNPELSQIASHAVAANPSHPAAAAAAAVAGDEPVAPAHEKPPVGNKPQQQAVANAAAAQVAQKAKAANAQLEKEIQSFHKDATLPPGHDALSFVETQDKATEATDRRYAFTFQTDDKGQGTWYLYKTAVEGNGIFEVRMVGKKFELDGENGIVQYDSIAEMLEDACDVTNPSRTLKDAPLPKEQEMRLVAFAEPAKQAAVVVRPSAAAAVSPKNMQLAVLDMSKPQELNAIVAFFHKETRLPEGALKELVPMHFREQGGKFVMPQTRADQHVFGRALLNLMPPDARQEMRLALTAPRPQAAASSVRIEEMPASPSKATANLAAQAAAEAAAKASKKAAATPNEKLGAAIRSINPGAILPAGHKALKAVLDNESSTKALDRHYAFALEQNESGKEAWFLYKTAANPGKNAVVEVMIEGGTFKAMGDDDKWHEYPTLQKMLEDIADIKDMKRVLK